MACMHESWSAEVDIANLTDKEGNHLDRRAVELRVSCIECGVKLQFVGMPAGLSVLHPTVSIDGLSAYLNAVPEGVVMSPLAEFALAFAPPKAEQN